MPSTQIGARLAAAASMLRNTGDDMWPQPGMKAENRPASPPMTNRWMWSGLGTIGMRDLGSRLYQRGRLRL